MERGGGGVGDVGRQEVGGVVGGVRGGWTSGWTSGWVD